MEDDFASSTAGLTSPASAGEMITPNDVSTLSYVTRALYVGTGGTVVVRMKSGDILTLSDLPTGTLCPIRVDQVLATGTTAGNLVGLR